MGTLSSVTTTTSTPLSPPLRDNNGAKGNSALSDKLNNAKPASSSPFQQETDYAKAYSQQQDFAEVQIPDPTTMQGNRRGSLLDLTV